MPARNGRTFSLTDEHDAFVDRLVSSGQYASASEVVRQGLRLLAQDERRRVLQKWLYEGSVTREEEAGLPDGALRQAQEHLERMLLDGIESGDAGELNRTTLEAIRARAREGARKKRKRGA